MSKKKPELLGLPELRALASDPRVLMLRLHQMLGGAYLRFEWKCPCGWGWSGYLVQFDATFQVELFELQRLEHLKTCTKSTR